jgi:hypothetical protein
MVGNQGKHHVQLLLFFFVFLRVFVVSIEGSFAVGD